MAELTPLYDDVEVRKCKGRFNVQLEIPETSTLTSGEVDRAGAISSWDMDPNVGGDGYEGGRAVLMRRGKEIIKQRIPLKMLQLSGIGYFPIDFSAGYAACLPDQAFLPPNKENFIAKMPGTKMSTSYAQDGKMITTRSKYRATGTYTHPELIQTIGKTIEAGKFQLEKLVTPHVEVYGRFLDDELRDENGSFGFIGFPVPDQPRAFQNLLEELSKDSLQTCSQEEAFLAYYYSFSSKAVPLIIGLRDLHDNARVSHLQPHLSNYYSVKSIPYLMDWYTMVGLSENKENNVINRAVDLLKPVDNYMEALSLLFPEIPNANASIIGMKMRELAMETYSGDPKKEINMLDMIPRMPSLQSTEFDIVVQWIKDQGIEGFPKYLPKQVVRFDSSFPVDPPKQVVREGPKIGRNNPCPCGSGKKYKKCCLG